jgi:hypothetical protein
MPLRLARGRARDLVPALTRCDGLGALRGNPAERVTDGPTSITRRDVVSSLINLL